MKFLSQDSGLMRALSDAIDAIWINILMIVTSIPIITIGAVLSAGHDATRRSLDGEGHVTTNYFKALRANFARSTVLWLVFGPILAILVYSWIVLQIAPLLIPKFAVSILWIIGFEWVWALQARFENTVGRTLANAFIFGISNIGTTLTLVVLDVVFAGLVVASWAYMPQGLFLLIVFGYGTLIMLHIPILEHALRGYTSPDEDGSPDRRGTAVDGELASAMRAKVEPDGVDTLVVDSARSAQVTGSSVAGSGSYLGDASQANAELRR